MTKSVFHDLKADRPELAAPLPQVLMALPVFTYLSVLAALGLGTVFMIQKTQAEQAAADHREKTATENAVAADTAAQMKAITEESTRAAEVAQWMNSTRPLSYIVAEVVNSMVDPNTMASLKLTRRDNNPDWINMSVVFNSGGANQVDKTSKKIESLGYQAATEDTKGGRDVNGASTYTATWAPSPAGPR